MATLNEIMEFLKNLSETDLYKVKIKTDEIEMTVQLKPDVKITQLSEPHTVSYTQPSIQNQANTQPTTNNKEEPKEEQDDNLVAIKSPMVGTFYRKPSPDKPPFVEIGDKVKKGQTVCIVEAMKLFNEIESTADGEIVKILVEDATPVEYDQPLFLVKPL